MDMSFLQDKNFTYVLLGVVSIGVFLIVLTTFFLIIHEKEKKGFKNAIKNFNEENYNKAINELKTNKKARGIYDKINLLLSRSQLRYEYSWNVFLFLILTLFCSLLGFSLTYEFLEGFSSSLIIGAVSGTLPLILTEILANFKGKKLRTQILSLIPVLINNAKLNGGNVFKTIKETSKKIKPPLNMFLEEFVSDFENGIEPSECFNDLRYKISDFRFKRIVDCLETHFYKGGNVVITLSSLNKEYLAREVEEDRRKKENSSRIMTIYICIIGNFSILYMINSTMPEIIDYLKENDIIVAIGILNILISLIVGYFSTKSQNSENK